MLQLLFLIFLVIALRLDLNRETGNITGKRPNDLNIKYVSIEPLLKYLSIF